MPEIEGIIEEDTGMKLQRAKTRVLLGKMRTADDGVFELAEQFGIWRESVLVDGAEVMGCPVGTDEFIEGWLREKMTGTVRDMRALKYFTRRAQMGCAALLREPEDDAPAADATTGAGHGTQRGCGGGGRTGRPGPGRHRAVVTNRVTSDAYAAELVAHTRVLEGLRSGTHQYQKIMAAHILSGSSPNTGHALRLVMSHCRSGVGGGGGGAGLLDVRTWMQTRYTCTGRF